VLELKPDHEEALEFLAKARPEPPAPPGPPPGLLRKLLRKP